MTPPTAMLNFQTQGEVHWSPERDELAFVVPNGLMVIQPDRDGSRVKSRLVYRSESPNAVLSFCWSQDGSHLAVLAGGHQEPSLWNIETATGHAEQIPINAEVGSAKLGGWTSD